MNTEIKRIFYTDEEVSTLIKLVDRYPIIRSKRNHPITWKKKKQAWHLIAEEYNSVQEILRTAYQLRIKFESLKRETRKYMLRCSEFQKNDVDPFKKSIYEKMLYIMNNPSDDLEKPPVIIRVNEEIINNKKSTKETIFDKVKSIIESSQNEEEINDVDVIPQIHHEICIEDGLKIERPESVNSNNEFNTCLDNNKEEDELSVREDYSRIYALKEEILREKNDRQQKMHELIMKKEEEMYNMKIQGWKLKNERKRLKIELLKRKLK